MIDYNIISDITILIVSGMIINYIMSVSNGNESKLWNLLGYGLITFSIVNLIPVETYYKLLISIIVACALGYIFAFVYQKQLVAKLLNILGLCARTSLKTSWEYALINRGNCYVIVHLISGEMYRGYYGNVSHASDYYEQLDLFLEQVYTYEEENGWVLIDSLDGVYIPFKEIQTIEFMKNEEYE